MIGSMHFNRVRIILAGLVLLPLAATGQTTNISRPIGLDQTDLMSVPLIVDGGNTVSNIFHDAPSGSIIYLWDSGLQTWTPGSSSAKGWTGIDTRELLPGEAFFFKPAWAYTVQLTGTAPTGTVTTLVPGMEDISLLGYPYPVDILWTDTHLADQLPPGSMVSFWNVADSDFDTTFFKAPVAKGGGWGNVASNTLIRAGDGFAVKQYGTNFNWSETP